ncbi:MAG TPA: copper homeostasis protein CutC [Saprospiraceae bacterium]|nr:copper homeostasis protein CutC [Saprospiraceae bacterium]
MIISTDYFLESCVTSLDSSILAEHHGAHRLEICDRLDTGGMTPDFDLVSLILDKIKIPIRVMIRATAIGFEADQDILQKMISSINQFKELPIDGFVIGIIKNNSVDKNAMELVIQACNPFPITFHKAIDESNDKWNDILWINDHPLIDTILTSGNAEKAMDGVEEILKMKSVFQRDIVAGGKITNDQLVELHDKLKLKWYHGRGIV